MIFRRKKFWLIFITLLFSLLGIYIGLLYPFSFLTARSAIGEKQIVKIGEREVVYYANGKGPKVILVASLGREASDFNELV